MVQSGTGISDALRAVIDAGPDDVQFMLIEGVPLYGDRKVMENFWSHSDLEDINLPGGAKAPASAGAGFVFSGVVARPVPALTAEGTSLAPLTDGGASKNGKN